MLKHFFISLLGALAAFWISFMLLFVIGVVMIAGTIVATLVGSSETTSVKRHSVLRLDLDNAVEERPTAPEMSLISMAQGNTRSSIGLNELLAAIAAAREDNDIDGIYMRFSGMGAGYATANTLRQALQDFRDSGKWVVAYADSYAQGEFYVATATDQRFLNPAGEVEIRGVGAQVPFYKGLMDKLGIEMQVLKVGTFKSAVEPYINTEMSEPARMQMKVYIDNIWQYLGGNMATALDKTMADVNQWADSMVMCDPAEKVLQMGLVTGLKYEHEVDDYIKTLAFTKEDKDVNYVPLSDYLASADVPFTSGSDNRIAVYYAYGEIVDGGDREISAEKMVPDILDLAKNDKISGLVLRVNSPGGSAFASEQIWEALQQFKAGGKPLYVSMGDYAASGGYYISCGADKIFASPVTLTGSIGIYGMIPNLKGLVTDKLGVNFSYVVTNPNAASPNILEPMTPFQRARMQKHVEDGYELFTRRCAEGRHMSLDSIKLIAQGRVWDGQEALKIGLVDQLGTLAEAVQAMADELGVGENYTVREYPSPSRNFWDIVASLQTDMEQRAVRNSLGAAYPVWAEIQKVASRNPVQARLPLAIQQL